MRDTDLPPDRQRKPTLYEVRVKGHLDDRWAEWFEGLSIARGGDDTTTLSGPVIDQASLHGVLRKVRDLALPLVSVVPIDGVSPKVSDVDLGADSVRSNTERDT
jgi:hypothetical protein